MTLIKYKLLIRIKLLNDRTRTKTKKKFLITMKNAFHRTIELKKVTNQQLLQNITLPTIFMRTLLRFSYHRLKNPNKEPKLPLKNQRNRKDPNQSQLRLSLLQKRRGSSKCFNHFKQMWTKRK